MNRRVFMGVAGAAALGAAADGGRKLRACVIGDTRHGGHGHSMHLVWEYRDDVEVVALADPDEEGRAKHAAEARAARQYADYREMLEKESPDLVAVGPRWTTNHLEYMKAVTDAGAHGILEKPLAGNLADADKMVDLVESNNLAWGIGFNFRVTPTVEHVRRMVMEEGIIGEVLEMRGRGKEDHRAGGEDLIVLGVHIFDAMRYFAGDARWCYADIRQNGRPAAVADVRKPTEPVGPILGDRISAMFGFDSGITGHFATMQNRDGNGGRWGLDIFGTKGVASLRMNGSTVAGLFPSGAWAMKKDVVQWQPFPGAPEDTFTPFPRVRYSPIIDDVLLSIVDGKATRRPKVSLHDGRQAQEMVQAVYAAHTQGGRVELPLADRSHPLVSS